VCRRPVMIGADLGRAALLALLPLAAVLGMLRVEYLYAVAFLTGGLSLIFDVAQSAWLPGLVQTDHDALLEANSTLEVSRWSVQIAGPGLATGLVQLAGAPLALLADSASFVVSALLLSGVSAGESTTRRTGKPSRFWHDIPAGLRVILRHPLLRTTAVTAALSNFFAYAQSAVLLLVVTRELGLPPTVYGVMLGAFGLGGVCGSLGVRHVARCLGQRGAICAGVALMAAGDALVSVAGGPLPFGDTLVSVATGPRTFAAAGMVAGQLMTGVGLAVCSISMVSLRQALTPADLLGRVNATARLLAWGAIPAGALLGGALGDWIGLRPTLVVAAAGSGLVMAWVLYAFGVHRRFVTRFTPKSVAV